MRIDLCEKCDLKELAVGAKIYHCNVCNQYFEKSFSKNVIALKRRSNMITFIFFVVLLALVSLVAFLLTDKSIRKIALPVAVIVPSVICMFILYKPFVKLSKEQSEYLKLNNDDLKERVNYYLKRDYQLFYPYLIMMLGISVVFYFIDLVIILYPSIPLLIYLAYSTHKRIKVYKGFV